MDTTKEQIMLEIEHHEPVYICGHVFRKERPVLYVCKDEGDWQFLCGEFHADDELPHVVGLGHLFEADPTLLTIINLKDGQQAERENVGGPWTVS